MCGRRSASTTDSSSISAFLLFLLPCSLFFSATPQLTSPSSVNGEYCFSCLEKTPADPRTPNLSGFDMCAYMTRFAEKFLQGKIVYNTEVRRIRRGQGGRGWELEVSSKTTGEDRVVRCARLVLCSGVCTVIIARIPCYLLNATNRAVTSHLSRKASQ